MINPREKILQRLRMMPMVVALPSVAAGIVLADWLRVPLWCAALLFTLSMVAAWRWRNTPLTVALMLLAGATSLSLRRSTESLPTHHTTMELRLERLTHEDDSFRTHLAQIVAYADGEQMRRSNSTIRLSTPLSAACSEGEHLVVNCSVQPFTSATSYGDYLQSKGIVGTAKICNEDILLRKQYFSLGAWLQTHALHRISKLNLSPSTRSIATAISVGQRSHIPTTQRRHYTLSGGAHLLAVSGLHVGFVFMLINFILLPLAALPHGTLWRTLLGLAMIWCYAAMTALSPSVMRATIMLSILQLSFFFSSRSRTLNTLCATTSLMLLWDGRMLYDVGFLLSVLAVIAIVEWASPLYHILRRDNDSSTLRYQIQHPFKGSVRRIARNILGWIAGSVIVCFVANIATLPLASLYFGELSLWGFCVGWVMVALCSVATTVMLTWILMPIPLFAPAVEWTVKSSVGAMNGIAEWCANHSLMSFTLRLDQSSCMLIYAALLLLTLALWSITPTRRDKNL